jgi:hypothetical protein
MSDTPAPPRSRSLFSAFAGLSNALSALRAPFSMSVITILVLWLPEQVREIYRVLVQRYSDSEVADVRWQWALAAVSLLLLSIVLWQVTRELAHAASEEEDADRQPIARFVREWAPRLFATAPFIGAGLGFWYSFLPNKRTLVDPATVPVLQAVLAEANGLQSKLAYDMALACAAAVAVFLGITLFERAVLGLRPGRNPAAARGRRLFLVTFWFVFPVIGALSALAFALRPMELPQFFGVIPIFALWVAIGTVLLAAATRFQARTGIPLITLVLIAAFVFEFTGWSDNHRFRHSEQTVTRPSLDEAFAGWIASRKDRAAFADAPYPVYVVAAEGGGIYAAYHAAKILSRIQDLCPNFAQHVFAISSVSGGSLGAGIFTALAQKDAHNLPPQPCRTIYQDNPTGFEHNAEKLLSQDFLSPLVWAGLFPDFLQRFLPVPIYAFDRATTLEKSFERAWDLRQGGSNPFRNSFFDLCSPGSATCAADATAPALLINATNVETGAQMVLSPLYLGQTYILQAGVLEDFFRKSATINQLPLSTAVGLSARFPWVLPVGWHDFTLPAPAATGELPQYRRMTFVDGGYYEGSGVATAENLVQYLLKAAQLNPAMLGGVKIAPKIIMITGSYQPVDNFYETEPHKKSYDELTAPLSTLLMAWRARSSAAPVEAEADNRQGPFVARSAQFDNDFLPLPLGWQLADLSRHYLDLFTGRPQDCSAPATAGEEEDTFATLRSIRRNDCLIKSVIADLRSGPAPAGAR